MDLSTTGMALFLYTLRSIPVPVRCLAKPALDIPVPCRILNSVQRPNAKSDQRRNPAAPNTRLSVITATKMRKLCCLLFLYPAYTQFPNREFH